MSDNIGRTAGEAVELSKRVEIVIVNVPGLDSASHIMLTPKAFREQCHLFGGHIRGDLPLVSEIQHKNILVIGSGATISKLR